MHQLLDQLKQLAHIPSQNGSCELGELLCRNAPGHTQHLLVRNLPVRVGGNLVENTHRITHTSI
ncbi:hypothetical protein D3C81_2060350 [compost metagenome]